MKIDKITICNLTSLEGEQVIDFTREPLRSAGLFAITGDTGTGKSTILDAICLALYNRAPRFEGAERMQGDAWRKDEDRSQAIQAGDVRNILRRGCNEGYCRVEFTATDGARYEAGWQLRRKRTGTYNTVTRSLRCLAPRRETVAEAEVADRIVQIVGLDYTQFTRTVILAQNSFANFLHARRDEKSALLEKLTGTEIYGRISQQVHELTEQARRTVDDLEHIVEGILHDQLLPSEVEALSEERTLLTARADAAARRRASIERQLQWFAQYDTAVALVRAREGDAAASRRAQAAMRAEQLQLERYDSLLGVQPLYQQISMRRADIAASAREEAEAGALIVREEAALQTTTAALSTARDRVVAAERTLAARRPAISRGHTLTGEITEVESQLRKADEQATRTATAQAEQEARLQAKRTQVEATAREIEQLQFHRQALSAHKPMFDKFDLVKDKLSMLTSETRRNAELHKRLAELQKRQTELARTAESFVKKQQADQDRLLALRGELQVHRQANKGRDSSELQQRAADCRNRLLVLEQAQALWARISAGYAAIEDKTTALKRHESEQEQLRRDIVRAEMEAGAVEDSYHRLQVALTLSQSENIVQLRRQLKEGAACPVCGATHHPYHTETERELGELLSNLGREFKEVADQRAARQERLEELRRQLAASEGRLTVERANLAESQERQRAAVAEWSTAAGIDPSLAECSPSVNREARRLTLGLLLDGTKRTDQETRAELETFNFHQRHADQLSETIGQLDTQMADDRAYLDNLHTQQQIAAASAADTEQSMQLSDRSCGELYADLGEMVTLSGWFTEWKNNADNLRLRLAELYQDWQQTLRQLEAAQRSEALLREEVKAAAEAAAEAGRQAQRDAAARDAVAETLAAKRQELARLFPSTTPEQEEQRLLTEQTAAREAEAAARTAADAATTRLSELRGKRSQLVDKREAMTAELQRSVEEMDQWISRYNGSHPPVQPTELETLFAEPRDWKALRDRLSLLAEAATQAESRLEAARQALLTLQGATDRPADETEGTRAQLTAEAGHSQSEEAQLRERLAQVGLRLMAHAESQRKAAAYDDRLAAARADREEWRRLDSLLGSADGKKFRQAAQHYTFRYLVAHANSQLRQFSPRYELRAREDSLMLEIIDRDMFDQRRYVYSLSGGETFVVSLALALGLASLSSEGLAIGSLFIDEGFGNLDHTSLELVMTALSGLENTQGRKVGVISHTDQIRSQISPQVHLVRLPAGGRSRIEIG